KITKPADLSSSERAQVPEIKGEVEFKNLSFAFNGNPVLKGISLRIPRGSTFSIVGETGSGKSSLVNLLARVYDFNQGEILIDGLPIQNYPLKSLRSQMAYVPQETFLFSETL